MMPNQATKYSLLISCPGDITDELNIIEECVKQFNTFFSPFKFSLSIMEIAAL